MLLRFAPLRSRLLAMSQTTGMKCAATRAFSLESNLKGKERVEEDLFMKKQERAFFEQKRADVLESERKAFQATMDPTIAEVNRILKSTNDSVSKDGLEALARWKAGL